MAISLPTRISVGMYGRVNMNTYHPSKNEECWKDVDYVVSE